MADGIFAILRMWNMKIPGYSPYQDRFMLASARYREPYTRRWTRLPQG